MPLLRSEVTVAKSDDIVADMITNTVFHTNDDSGFNPAVDYQNHADQVRDCFSGNAANYTSGSIDIYAYSKITVKVYDMADAKPRPERAVSIFTPSSWDASTTFGPGQVALCLSFYAGRNLPRTRGRLYLGPWHNGQLAARPSETILQQLLTFGHSLFDVGGENVAWVVHSEVANSSAPITDIWADDSWDVQRRRKRKATKRDTLHP